MTGGGQVNIRKLQKYLKVQGKKLDAELILEKKAEFIEQTFSELFKSFNEFCDIHVKYSNESYDIHYIFQENIKTLGLERLYETGNDKHQLKILNKFLSVKYEPPDNIPELLNHISSIFLYQNLFRQTDSIPLNVLFQFDLVLMKLIQKAKHEVTVWVLKTGKDKGRLIKSGAGMRKGGDAKIKKVISIYKDLEEAHTGKSLNWIAKEIQKKLSDDDLKITTKTIGRYIDHYKKKGTKTFEPEKIYYFKDGQIRKR